MRITITYLLMSSELKSQSFYFSMIMVDRLAMPIETSQRKLLV